MSEGSNNRLKKELQYIPNSKHERLSFPSQNCTPQPRKKRGNHHHFPIGQIVAEPKEKDVELLDLTKKFDIIQFLEKDK